MKTTLTTLALCALLLAGACSNDQPAATGASSGTPAVASQQASATPAQLTPEQLGELGAAIRKNPADAKRLLTERGLDEQKFEQAVRKVAEDPAAAKRYSESYKKAGA